MTQYYLIRVQKMCTSDEADCVAGWSAILAEENLDRLVLSDAAAAAGLSLKDCPLENIRPMTEAEIAEWRDRARDADSDD